MLLKLIEIVGWFLACWQWYNVGIERGRREELRETDAIIDRLEKLID